MTSDNKLQAVLFDMDGTLLEPDEHDHLKTFKLRWAIPEDQLVVPNLSKLPSDAYADFMTLEAGLARYGELRPHVTELLHALQARGVKTALVTNNSRVSANTVMHKFNLRFNAVLTRDDTVMKPDPAMLLQALEQLRVAPTNAVMIGDTRADSSAAIAAQVRHCYLIAEPWNVALEGQGVIRVTNFAALNSKLLERL